MSGVTAWLQAGDITWCATAADSNLTGAGCELTLPFSLFEWGQVKAHSSRDCAKARYRTISGVCNWSRPGIEACLRPNTWFRGQTTWVFRCHLGNLSRIRSAKASMGGWAPAPGRVSGQATRSSIRRTITRPTAVVVCDTWGRRARRGGTGPRSWAGLLTVPRGRSDPAVSARELRKGVGQGSVQLSRRPRLAAASEKTLYWGFETKGTRGFGHGKTRSPYCQGAAGTIRWDRYAPMRPVCDDVASPKGRGSGTAKGPERREPLPAGLRGAPSDPD